MARRPRDPPPVDLTQFSAAECARIWEVLQKDFHIRFREEQRLHRLRSQLAKAEDKALTLGTDPNFNEKYCVICFRSFWVLFNPKERCLLCLCNVCRSCSRYLKPHESWLCCLCEEERAFAAKQCLWFYDGTTKKFVVGGNPTPIPMEEAEAEDGDPLADQLRKYLQEFVARIKQDGDKPNFSEEGIEADVGLQSFSSVPRKPERGHLREEALKRITGHQVMRFHQKISDVTSDVERFLRTDVRYEIPEAGVNAHYDQNMEAFRGSVANILRNFSQSLYIAIEAHQEFCRIASHHSKTGELVEDVQLGVQQILQDEVESLVGCRVDIPTDDDAASMISDDVGRSNDLGLTIHDRLADCLLNKLLNDHQTFLDDQQLTASDMYTETALERVLAQKSERRNFGEFSGGLFGQEVDPDLLSAGGSSLLEPRALDCRDVAQKALRLDGSVGSSSGSGANWLLAGHPTAKCSDSLRGFGPKNEHSDESGAWKDLGDFDDESGDDMSSLSSNLGVSFPVRPITDRKVSLTSLEFDDVYRRNLTLAKDPETPKEKLEQSSRSEDSGVHVTSSSPPASDRKTSLGFSRMDWSFNERSDPHFVAKPEQVVVEAGECAVIEVAADGTLPIDIFWHRCSARELHQLEEKDRVEFLSAPDHPGKSSLLLWEARREDAGEYLASAVNENGSAQQGFKVVVTERTSRQKPPEFLQEVSDEFVREGGTARLFCKVQGRPKPRVQFLRDGRPVRSSDKTRIMRIGQRSVSLTIFDVRMQDEGTYVCLATNCSGSARCEARVQISTSDLYYTDTTPAVDMSPAVKVKAQVSRLSSEAPSVLESPIRSSSGVMNMAEPKTQPTVRDDRRLRREGPKAKQSETTVDGIQPSNQSDRVFKRQESSTRKNFRIPDESNKKEEKPKEENERKEKEDMERTERRERAEKKREEKERKEREEREEKKRREREKEEKREREMEERSRKFEKKTKEEKKREEEEARERRERESKEWEEREEKEKKEKEKMKKEEERRRRKEEKEREERRERREKERRGREQKERREKEERERVEKEERERKAVEEKIRLRRLERERREREEEERREKEEMERKERGEEEEEEYSDEEQMEEMLASEVCASLPDVRVDGKSHFPHGGRSLQLSSRSLSPARQTGPGVSDIKCLIENGKLQPSYTPNMKASFRTRKFPSVPAIRDQLSLRGAYGKRPNPVPVKISGKTPTVKKSEGLLDPSESASEDFRSVTLKSTGLNLRK